MKYVYIVRCADGSLYVGSTDNVDVRIASHNEGRGGQHTRARRPVTLVFEEAHETDEDARRRERQLKRWTTAKKEALIRGELAMLRSLAISRSSPRKKGRHSKGRDGFDAMQVETPA
jgi:putative endonuclease